MNTKNNGYSPVDSKRTRALNDYKPLNYTPPIPDNWQMVKMPWHLSLILNTDKAGQHGLQLMTIDGLVATKEGEFVRPGERCFVLR